MASEYEGGVSTQLKRRPFFRLTLAVNAAAGRSAKGAKEKAA